jgi:hypothetical protein
MEVYKKTLMESFSFSRTTNRLSFVIKLYQRTPKITRYVQRNYVKTPIYEGYSERTKVIKNFDKVINPIKFVNEDILKLDLEKRFILSIIEKIGVIPE